MSEHEHLPPPGYIQPLPVSEHGDDIADGVETIRLIGQPAIIRALNLIREDSGGPSWPPESEPLIASAWEPHLALIDAALASLSDSAPAPEDADAAERLAGGEVFSYLDSEFYTFCNGESTVVEAITNRSEALRLASAFLNDFFEGWSMGVPE